MPYALSWAEDRAVIRVRHYGAVTVDEIQASLDDIAGCVDPNDLPGLLVNHEEVTEYPDQAELMFLAQKNAGEPRVSSRTAFVVSDITAEVVAFVVIAATNRGYLARDFSDEREARAWLLGPRSG